MYDGVLTLPLPRKMKIVGHVDDVSLTVMGATVKERGGLSERNDRCGKTLNERSRTAESPTQNGGAHGRASRKRVQNYIVGGSMRYRQDDSHLHNLGGGYRVLSTKRFQTRKKKYSELAL